MSNATEGQGWLPQHEWERLLKVWRTRANEEFERAEAAEARERAKDEALRYMALNMRLIAGYERITGDHEDCEVAREVLADPSVQAALAQQPADQPAQPDRPKCSHTRLTADRCLICGPLDSDNRPKAPDQPAQGGRTRLREQVDQAQAEVATWPEWMTRSYPNPAKPLDPHTLERAAELADQRAYYLTKQGANAARDIAAAIRNLRGDGGDT